METGPASVLVENIYFGFILPEHLRSTAYYGRALYLEKECVCVKSVTVLVGECICVLGRRLPG